MSKKTKEYYTNYYNINKERILTKLKEKRENSITNKRTFVNYDLKKHNIKPIEQKNIIVNYDVFIFL